jgi:hypothetical protein
MADGPSVRRIKREKRELGVKPAPAGMSRRRFLTFLGTGSAALAAGSAGVLTSLCRERRAGLGESRVPERRVGTYRWPGWP